MMVMASRSLGMTVPPLSSALNPAIRSCGQSERFNRVRFLTPACAGAGSCPPRDSSRATGWQGARGDWGPLRYTWEHHSDCLQLMEAKTPNITWLQLTNQTEIMPRYQSLDSRERGKRRLSRVTKIYSDLPQLTASRAGGVIRSTTRRSGATELN